MDSSWPQTGEINQQFYVPSPSSYNNNSPFPQNSNFNYNPSTNNQNFGDYSIPVPTPPTPITPNSEPIIKETPPPPTTEIHTSTQLINRMIQLHTEQEVVLKMMRQKQKNLFQNPTVEVYQQLSNEQKELKEKLDYEIKSVNILFQQTLLQPGELHRVEYLKDQFQLQLKQLELYYYELEQLRLQRRATRPFVFLHLFFLIFILNKFIIYLFIYLFIIFININSYYH